MLKVSSNKRYLTKDDGTPWFYLADTIWELFHRTTREEADLILSDRAAKGFTAIQAVVLAEMDGLRIPNSYGHLPLHECDPEKPNEEYMRHVDWVVARANELGMYVAMLPTWGDKWNQCWGKGPEIFNSDNAYSWGRYLGTRYRDADVIWVLGGDRQIHKPEHADVIDRMAEGLKAGDEGRHLMTFHPNGQFTSAQHFHNRHWLDFNMYQTGHTFGRDNWRSIIDDFLRLPTKPCLDAEPGYEHHPSGFKIDNGLLTDVDCRQFAYWAICAGACGHTYGCHEIWQLFDVGRESATHAFLPWREAMHLPGSGQMKFVRQLIESGPYLDRIPDLNMVVDADDHQARHIQACRGSDDRFVMVYFPLSKTIKVNVHHLGRPVLRARWFNPVNGQWFGEMMIDAASDIEVTPPSWAAPDALWVADA